MAIDAAKHFEPVHASAATDGVIHELQIYGHRPIKTNPTQGPYPTRQESAAPSTTSSTSSFRL